MILEACFLVLRPLLRYNGAIMESMKALQKKAISDIEGSKTLEDLRNVEIDIFGRKQGRLTAVLRSLASLSAEKRRVLGGEANKLRAKLQGKLEEKKRSLEKHEQARAMQSEKIDVTFPGVKKEQGHLHPLTLVRMESERIFNALGYAVVEGPEVENEYYNFDSLNIPKNHPSRDQWDTFWIKSDRAAAVKGKREKPEEKYLMRTHTSPVQVRYMEEHNPPFRIIVPGKVFRHEATDASHDFEFWHLEGLTVGKDVSVANLVYTLGTFFKKIFGKESTIRLRPSFFPFVEPGFEFDISCLSCRGKGCSVCKQTGWVELGGAGMVHPKVFEAAGYAKGEWQGFAFGVGLDRIALMKYKIPDIRLFRANDIRFLKQF